MNQRVKALSKRPIYFAFKREHMAAMVIGKAFTPLVGKCYDLRFGKIRLDEQEVYCSARIRVNGSLPSQWEDIDTGLPLDQRLSTHRIQAYREIPNP
jgi:hypothetical protein